MSRAHYFALFSKLPCYSNLFTQQLESFFYVRKKLYIYSFISFHRSYNSVNPLRHKKIKPVQTLISWSSWMYVVAPIDELV